MTRKGRAPTFQHARQATAGDVSRDLIREDIGKTYTVPHRVQRNASVREDCLAINSRFDYASPLQLPELENEDGTHQRLEGTRITNL